ncbi:Glutathione S-transferase [Mycena kentingensis (nom. inval.)]|nr:Glutathione S-transferase [Mycena kentingensis (nom. inval.)]
MVFKLYSAGFLAGGGLIVALVLNEKSIPFEHITVNAAEAGHKTAEFLEKHPFGQLPVIDDDGFILYETRAILRYIENKFPARGIALAPGAAATVEEKALFDRGLSVEHANFFPAVFKVMNEAVLKPHYGKQTDEAILKTGRAELEARLDVYEVILSKQKYTGGEVGIQFPSRSCADRATKTFSFVDLLHLWHVPVLAQMGKIEVMNNEKRPNILRYVFFSSIELISPDNLKLVDRGFDSPRISENSGRRNY